MKKILVTGICGFIGFHFAKKLLSKNIQVIGIDSINSYYSKKLKLVRLNELYKLGFSNFYKFDLNNKKKLNLLFDKYNFDLVVHFAAQAGVRYSFINPESYLKNNINAFFYLLENCKRNKISKIFFASTSSIYGSNTNKKFNEDHPTDNQIQFYSVTKKTNEIFAKFYAENYKIHILSMRFFTVYGPWGRPDMAPYIFIDNIYNEKRFNLFNKGLSLRDFTYIDDLINSIFLIYNSNKYFKKKKYYDVINFGNEKSIKVKTFLNEVGNQMNKNPKFVNKKLPPGDMTRTLSDSKKLLKITNYLYNYDYKKGISETIEWYHNYINGKYN